MFEIIRSMISWQYVCQHLHSEFFLFFSFFFPLMMNWPEMPSACCGQISLAASSVVLWNSFIFFCKILIETLTLKSQWLFGEFSCCSGNRFSGKTFMGFTHIPTSWSEQTLLFFCSGGNFKCIKWSSCHLGREEIHLHS